ncbi:MAG: DUF3025 domain-containing protein [Pseudomonadota bacterium]
MNASFLKEIDWRRPWLAPLLPAAAPILQAQDWREALNAAAFAASLCNHRGLPIRFVPQSDLPADTPYEAFISATGGVPTRSNLHDFFNALVWLTFPKAKAQLNALQAMEIAGAARMPDAGGAHGARRGKLRDAATIFDENAAILVATDQDLVAALRGHQWRELFIARRDDFSRDCTVCLFGHALMEKLVSPYKAITAHAYVLLADKAFFAVSPPEMRGWIDLRLATALAQGLSTADFTPLPVLGVPGWWDVQDLQFYDDVAVFRPKRAVVLKI